jgi:hypothetical protein
MEMSSSTPSLQSWSISSALIFVSITVKGMKIASSTADFDLSTFGTFKVQNQEARRICSVVSIEMQQIT